MTVFWIRVLTLSLVAASLAGVGLAWTVGMLESGAIELTDVLAVGVLGVLVLAGLAGLYVESVTREMAS